MNDLGVKQEPMDEPVATKEKSEEPRIEYPRFELRGKAVDLAGASDMSPGDEVEVMVKLRVTERVKRERAGQASTDPWDNSVGFDVLAMDPLGSDGEEEEDEEESVLGFKRPKPANAAPVDHAAVRRP